MCLRPFVQMPRHKGIGMPKKKHAPAPQKQKTPEVVEKPEEAGEGAAATTATGSSPAAAPANVDLELGELPQAARKVFAELNLKIDDIDTDELLHAQAMYEYKRPRSSRQRPAPAAVR